MKQDDMQVVADMADLLHSTLTKLLADSQGGKPETRVAAAGRMAGTLLHRALAPSEAPLEPGSVVTLADGDRDGPLLMDTLFATLRQLGHVEVNEAWLRGTNASTASSGLSLAETRQLLEPWYQKVHEVSGLSYRATAAAAAMATALQVHACAPQLDIREACSIAIHGMVEGLKTVPEAVPAS